ncbi:MAG TPA: hypothetical protein VJZ73_21105, partial [Methylomirabilota bacterium]|nr:hypothetical protein [Methylomirabilota bacterium]
MVAPIRHTVALVRRAPVTSAGRFQRRDASLSFAGDAGPVTVTICSPRIVRVSFGASATASGADEVSFVGPRAWAPTPFDVADGEPVRVSTRDLRLEVDTSPLRLTFADAAGAWLLREPGDGGMT